MYFDYTLRNPLHLCGTIGYWLLRMEDPIRQRNPILVAIADRPKRTILALLRDRTPPLTERRVATYLAVQEQGKAPENVAPEERRSVLKRLRHAQLPALDELGLVRWRKQDATVTPADHPVFDDPAFNAIINMEEKELDEVLAAISHRRHRLVLCRLMERERAMSRTELAEEILRCDNEGPDPRGREEVVVALHHRHLPMLDNAELITYDEAGGRAAYTPNPVLERVFGVLYEPESPALAKVEGFIDGLESAAEEMRRTIGTQSDLPETWNEVHNA